MSYVTYYYHFYMSWNQSFDGAYLSGSSMADGVQDLDPDSDHQAGDPVVKHASVTTYLGKMSTILSAVWGFLFTLIVLVLIGFFINRCPIN